jgi:steroid delta-isomerase-like uncharacterized protein
MKPSSICLALAIGLTPCLKQVHGSKQNSTSINTNAKSKEVIMSVNERNKETVRKLFEEVFNKGRMELLKDLISDDYVGVHGGKGAPAFQAEISGLLAAFPDIHYQLVNLVSDDNAVAVSWTWKGTHKAAFRNYPATGKLITNEGMAIFGCRDGKITGQQIQTDRLAFLQQLGIVPANPGPVATAEVPRFIDKFFIPAAAIDEFHHRMKANRDLLRTLPGFIKDAAYEHLDESGNLICITIAEWASTDAMGHAKETVQAEYKKEGFDMQGFLKRLNISMERGLYTELKD